MLFPNATTLEVWLLTCLESGIVEVANFAHGLQKEFSALRAALTRPEGRLATYAKGG